MVVLTAAASASSRIVIAKSVMDDFVNASVPVPTSIWLSPMPVLARAVSVASSGCLAAFDVLAADSAASTLVVPAATPIRLAPLPAPVESYSSYVRCPATSAAWAMSMPASVARSSSFLILSGWIGLAGRRSPAWLRSGLPLRGLSLPVREGRFREMPVLLRSGCPWRSRVILIRPRPQTLLGHRRQCRQSPPHQPSLLKPQTAPTYLRPLCQLRRQPCRTGK